MKILALISMVSLALAASPKKKPADLYTFNFSPTSIEVGKAQAGTLDLILEVKVKGGYVHSKSPFNLKAAATGLELERSEFKRTDAKVGGQEAEARRLEFVVPFISKGPGQFDLKADLEFYLCMEKVCERETGAATAKVVVR